MNMIRCKECKYFNQGFCDFKKRWCYIAKESCKDEFMKKHQKVYQHCSGLMFKKRRVAMESLGLTGSQFSNSIKKGVIKYAYVLKEEYQ